MQNSRIVLAPPERRELRRRSGRRSGRADDAKRARLILGLAGGQTYGEIMNTLACSQNYIVRWKSRFLEQRIGGLYARHQGRKPAQNAAQLEARILNYTRRGPRDGSTHWSTRKLGKTLGISHNRVHRTWRRVGLQPHRLRRYMLSDDPQFEKKAADIIGLYLKPPTNAAVFCVDEKALSKPWIGSIRFCLSLPEEPNGMALSITAMARSHSMGPWRHAPVKWWQRPPLATPAPSLSPF